MFSVEKNGKNKINGGGVMDKIINKDEIKMLENIRTDISNLGELMMSIKQHGLLHPIGVWKENDEYIICFGHRRFKACCKLGWTKFEINKDIKVFPEKITEEQFLIYNTIENMQREDINPVELGRIIRRLKNLNFTNSEIAAKLSVTQTRVKQAYDLFVAAPNKFKDKIGWMAAGDQQNKKGKIPVTVAHAILNCRMTKEMKGKMLEAVEREELTLQDIALLRNFLDLGASIEEALEKRREYTIKSFCAPFSKKELEKMWNKYHPKSFKEFIYNMMTGKIPLNKNLIYKGE